MSIEQSDAIVLRIYEFMESSVVATVYTRDFGKVRGLAKGARRLKNPFENSLDLLVSNNLTFIKKNSDALDLFTKAKLVRRFLPDAKNRRALYAAYYVVELLDLMTELYDPNPQLWRAADLALQGFGHGQRAGERLFAFEAFLLDAFGEFPSTRHCVECGEELPLDRPTLPLGRPLVFDFIQGGVICKKCLAAGKGKGCGPTTVGALRALEVALRTQYDTLLYDQSFQLNLARQLEEARKAFETTRHRIRENARAVYDRLDEITLARLGKFEKPETDQLPALLNRYFMRILRRRPRLIDYLGYATRGEDYPSGLEDNFEYETVEPSTACWKYSLT